MEKTNVIERKVPMDIRSYKMKIIGPLNIRQTIIAAIIIIIDAILYLNVIKPLELSTDTIMWIAFFVDAPLIFSGWFAFGDLTAEQFIYYKFIHKMKTKQKRYYEHAIYRRKPTYYNPKEEQASLKDLEAEMITNPDFEPFD